jgi:uncharacterized membrane protein required for colicin V production
MTWFDAVAILIIILIAWAESVRGFGRALFDVIGAIIAAKLASFLCRPLAEVAPVAADTGPSEAFWLATVFVVLLVLVVIATKIIYESTLLSLDVLDPILGAIFGIVSGMMVAYVLLRMLELAYAGTEFADVVAKSFTGQELLGLRTYHIVVNALQDLGSW